MVCAGFRRKRNGDWVYSGTYDHPDRRKLQKGCDEMGRGCVEWQRIQEGKIGWRDAGSTRWTWKSVRTARRQRSHSADAGLASAAPVIFSQAVGIGIIWMAISIVIDLPLMLAPPVNMTLGAYAADVGLTYVMIPVIVVGVAWAGRLGLPMKSDGPKNAI